MKYRKKPIVIEAEQFHYDSKPWPDGVVVSPNASLVPEAWIETLEGGHVVSEGDFIVTGILGERYPCKADIFEATYGVVCDGHAWNDPEDDGKYTCLYCDVEQGAFDAAYERKLLHDYFDRFLDLWHMIPPLVRASAAANMVKRILYDANQHQKEVAWLKDLGLERRADVAARFTTAQGVVSGLLGELCNRADAEAVSKGIDLDLKADLTKVIGKATTRDLVKAGMSVSFTREVEAKAKEDLAAEIDDEIVADIATHGPEVADEKSDVKDSEDG